MEGAVDYVTLFHCVSEQGQQAGDSKSCSHLVRMRSAAALQREGGTCCGGAVFGAAARRVVWRYIKRSGRAQQRCACRLMSPASAF
jgi:hypothetical protein